ncbi:Caspase domain, partial [Rhizoctonia solani]
MNVASMHDLHREPQVVETQKSIKSQYPIWNLHALLIGIDTYKKVVKLTGASKDADSMEEFLLSDLSVPASQITNLRNEQATRSGMIAALTELRRNPDIDYLDPILIYYAGHGCEVDTPSTDWGSYHEKTQCLVPWDAGALDSDGKLIPPIPDYTIAALLYALAAEKGNNITVIFDCCHSASSTRGVQGTFNRHAHLELKITPSWKLAQHHLTGDPKKTAHRPRRLNPEDLPPLSRDVDADILQTHISSHIDSESSPKYRIPLDRDTSGFHRFGRSHILLAACGHAEVAYECANSDSGFFTTALLEQLRSRQIHKMTYKACFENFPRLPTPSLQSPVCEGDKLDRLLFSTTVPEESRIFIPMRGKSNGYVLKAGFAQGVIPGSKYGIYGDDLITEKGTFTANPLTDPKLYPCQTQCDIHQGATIPTFPRARLLERGQFHMYQVYLTDAFKNKFSAESTLEIRHGIIQADSKTESKAVLDVDRSGGGITIEIAGLTSKQLHKCLPEQSRIQKLLFSMAQWDWHLFREPEASSRAKGRAQLYMYRLDEAGPSLVPLDNGVATLMVPSKELYGFRIKSLFHRRLYAYLFYFSTKSQSIKPLFLSVCGNGYVDAPLEANGELTIGYGNDDMISGPISFQPETDVGYFKLFLTTVPGDFDLMAQLSPFAQSENGHIASLIGGDRCSSGIDIRGCDPTDSSQAALVNRRMRPVDRSGRPKITSRLADGLNNLRGNGHTTPILDTASNHLHSHVDGSAEIHNFSMIGQIPRTLSSSEAAERLDNREIWETVCLQVTIKRVNH